MKRLLIAFALLIAPVAAQAATVQNLDLGKHAQVWFAEDHTVPVVAISISLPAGSAYDPAGRAGLAAFAGAMLDEGAGNLDSKAFHQALADKAIGFSARVDRDYLVISISSLKENVPEALRLLQLALTRPHFEAEPLARIKTQIIQSLQQDEAEPPRLSSRTFMRAFFGGHAYAHPTTGEIASISAINAADLRGFAKTHWVSYGVKIAVAGDITAPVLQKLLGTAFTPVSNHVPPALPPVGRLGQPGVHVVPLAVPQATATFGLPGIMRSDPGRRRILVAPDGRDPGEARSHIRRLHLAELDEQGQCLDRVGRDPRRRHSPDGAGGEGHHEDVCRQWPDTGGAG